MPGSAVQGAFDALHVLFAVFKLARKYLDGMLLYNKKAKDESKKMPSSQEEYDNRHGDIGNYQKVRTVGVGVAILGGIGLGLSIAF